MEVRQAIADIVCIAEGTASGTEQVAASNQVQLSYLQEVVKPQRIWPSWLENLSSALSVSL